MKKLFLGILLVFAVATYSQGATINAASCSLANVNTAITSATQGDTVQIPTGTCEWAAPVTLNKGITIRGNGTSSTTITSTGSGFFTINGSGSNYRITNMAFRGSSSDGTDIEINGYWTSMRIDNINWQTSSSRGIWLGRNITGDIIQGQNRPHEKALIDNIYYAPAASGGGRPFLLLYGRQHKAWEEADGFGTDNFVFIEDSTFVYTYSSSDPYYIVDTEYGGRYVARYNTITNARTSMHDLGGGTYRPSRGNRAAEVYSNTISASGGTGWNPITLRGGTAVVYNNTITGYSAANRTEIYRVSYDSWAAGGGYCGATPTLKRCVDLNWRCTSGARDNRPCNYDSSQGWGHCTEGDCTLDCSTNADCLDINGTQLACMTVDGGGTGGYACRDQVGRGADNSTTGVQASSPVYWWNNTLNGSPVNMSVSSADTSYIVENRDYYNTSKSGYTAYDYPHPWRTGEQPPEDTTAPNISNATASQIACDAESPVNVTLSVSTNENAYCAYSTSDVAYASMTAFTSTGGGSHSSTISLACDDSYTYYVRCRDTSPNQNTNTTSTSVAFTIAAAEAETGAPVITNGRPSGTLTCTANPRTVTLAVTATDEQAMTCRYSTTNQAYAAMPAGQTLAGDSTTFVQGVDDSYETMASTAYRELDSTRATEVGVSFTSQGGELDTVRFRLAKYGSPTGNATVKIYAHSGTYGTNSVPTGDALATSDNFDVSTLTTDQQWRTFTFSGANRITLVDDTYYVATVAYSGGNATNYVRFYRDNTTLGHDGNECYYQSGSWSVSTTRDPIFTVYTMQPSSSGASGDFTKDLSLACGSVYDYYVACTDGTTASDPTHISFGISGTSCQESGCIEFEDCTNASPMLEYADATASGAGYVSTTTFGQGTSTCAVTVAAGTYVLRARTMAADTGDDSVYLTIDEQAMVLLGLNTSQTASLWNVWNLDTMKYFTSGSNWQDYQFTLTGADPHSFVFTGREAGAKLDYFYLFPVDVPPPPPPVGGTTRFMIGTGQTMTIAPTTGGCTVIIE